MAHRRKRIHRPTMDRHHVVPRHQHGDNSEENVILIDKRWHAALHMVFAATHPREYLLKASTDPELYARRWVRALAHFFGDSILTEIES